jgi:LysM repeat protein
MMKEEKDWENRICPYLGQGSDPRTAFSYPSVLNCCFHAKPVAAIDIGHQEQFCLTSKYPNCEEYTTEPGALLPAGLHASHGRRSHKKHGNYWWVWGVILLILGFIAVWLMITPGGGFSQFSSAPTATIESTETSTEITPTVLSPTKPPTPSPTSEDTPTSRPLLLLEIPLGINHEFMIHQIQDGESLDLIAGEHGTTVATLLACNYRLPAPLLTGSKIVVPLVNIDTQGLPAFEVYNVTEEISLEDLAIRLSVDLNKFKHYNALDDDFIPRAGDWLLVPRAVSPTPIPSPIPTP